MRLYADLACWYTLLTPLEDYAEEAAVFREMFREALGPGRHTLLELGAGAGHNAHYLAADFDLCLVDLSPQMLELAAVSCPSAERLVGDMRSARVGRSFDAVFLHDAVCYMLTEADLRAAFETARAHLAPGGVFLIAPDYVRETFEVGTDVGGNDGLGRAMRYFEWVWQRPGEQDRYVVDYMVVTRVGEVLPEVHQDRHEEGLFLRETWLRLLSEAGFEVEWRTWRHSEVERELEVFLARARA